MSTILQLLFLNAWMPVSSSPFMVRLNFFSSPVVTTTTPPFFLLRLFFLLASLIFPLSDSVLICATPTAPRLYSRPINRYTSLSLGLTGPPTLYPLHTTKTITCPIYILTSLDLLPPFLSALKYPCQHNKNLRLTSQSHLTVLRSSKGIHPSERYNRDVWGGVHSSIMESARIQRDDDNTIGNKSSFSSLSLPGQPTNNKMGRILHHCC
mmetsp:Transcript_8569/g.12961  ORF Transcript_8569/g.12961 Transcript_8569/m.12961 type:complete len:209 (-) Transcript_8569:197-823(-)